MLVTADSVNPLFLTVGVEFYQEINGEMYALKNGSYNPLAIIRVKGLSLGTNGKVFYKAGFICYCIELLGKIMNGEYLVFMKIPIA